MPIRIQRRRTPGWKMPPNTVCVTRPGKWGNPWRVGQRTAADCVELFRTYALTLDVSELRGKNLACFCPLADQHGNYVPCHADVLLELANK